MHRKTPVPESLLIKLQGSRSATLLKKRLWHRCFPMNFAKFLRTPFITEHLRWLLLENRKTNELYRFRVTLADKFYLEYSNKITDKFYLEYSNKIADKFYLEYSNKNIEIVNSSICCTWKNKKSICHNSNFQCFGTEWLFWVIWWTILFMRHVRIFWIYHKSKTITNNTPT